jgi:hypothetical protein
MKFEQMEEALEHAICTGVIKKISDGDGLKVDYRNAIDITDTFKEAWQAVDNKKVVAQMTALLEQTIAEKLVNKVITEMGTDVKNLLSNASVRDDFKFMLRKVAEKMIDAVKERETDSDLE